MVKRRFGIFKHILENESWKLKTVNLREEEVVWGNSCEEGKKEGRMYEEKRGYGGKGG